MKNSELEKIIGLAEDYRNGIITESDYYDQVDHQLMLAFSDFNREYFGSKMWRKETQDTFQEGYKAWLRGEKTEKFGDGNTLFELIKYMNIPLEYYSTVPDNIKVPFVFIINSTTDGKRTPVWTVPYRCINDGGMFSDNDPAGKEYVLSNTIGLKTNLKVLSCRPGSSREIMDPENRMKLAEKKEKADNAKKTKVYVCTGNIEGYTAKERKDGQKEALIYIFRYEDDQVINMTLYPSKQDEEALHSYPLWKEYYEWLDAKNELKKKAIMAFKDRKEEFRNS